MRVLVAFALASSACSFMGVETARRVAPDRVECHADRAVPIVDTVVALAGITVAVALYARSQSETWLSQRIDRLGSVTAGTIGVVSGISAIYGYGAVASCERAEQLSRAEQLARREREQAREHARAAAWDATKQAAAAARAGDCAMVERLQGEVRMLDAELLRAVFLRDVAIMRCLTSPDAGL